MKELLESIDMIIENGKLTSEEIEFLKECKKSDNPQLYLNFYYLQKNPIIISIFNKLEKLI